jgi:dihydrofolate synthase/folylpolyglutamate synthase
MAEINNFAEAEKVLAAYIPLSREVTGRDITVKRMLPLMEVLGNPQCSLKIIHVAGTSGKTSTSYYIAALLTSAGHKTGLTVSPHVDSITERLQVNMQPLTEDEFCAALNEFLQIITEADLQPTYFELLIALAYWYFAKIGVNYAVIETGLGGLQDSTNVATNTDKLCVLTDIGYDHQHVLGKTLPEITAQKAGIIHPGNEVLMYQQNAEVMTAIEQRCREQGTHMHVFGQAELEAKIHIESFNDLPDFQKRNWLLANEVYSFLSARDGLKTLPDEKLEQTLQVRVPGRMDMRIIGQKTIIMDGAHNQQKMQAFVQSFKHQFPEQKATVLLGMKAGKEYDEVLPLLQPITDSLIICEFSAVQDTHIEAVTTEDLENAAKNIGYTHVIISKNPNQAYQQLLDSAGEIGIITGSFYLLGEIRKLHKELIRAAG